MKRSFGPGPLATAVVALAGVTAAGWNTAKVRDLTNPPIRAQDLDVQESQASASLMGQFRTTVSGWLWLRADLYLHNGVEMRPISDEELHNGVTVENAEDDGHEKLHQENEITVVPSRERDFRGVFGDVEREVTSYRDMHGHTHNDPSMAMPLYRLMTWLDPQFIQGWTMGGMILARDRTPGGTRLALEYLKEGWGANPQSVEIPSQIGYTIASRRGNLLEAIRFLDAARYYGFSRRRQLDEQEQDGLETAYRWLALCYRETRQPAKEVAVLREGMSLFPDDKVMPRLLAKATDFR